MIKSACHDNQAGNYDRNLINRKISGFDYIRENYFSIHDRVIELLNIKKTDRILDIGIGTGLLEEKINKKCEITGIDISKKMLDELRKKSLSIELKTGSFLKIPYPDSVFDSVLSCFAFHHLSGKEKKAALIEIERVIKKNGKLIIADFMYENLTKRKKLSDKFVKEGRLDMIDEMKEEYFTNISWLKNQIKTGFHMIKYEQLSVISWIFSCIKRV